MGNAAFKKDDAENDIQDTLIAILELMASSGGEKHFQIGELSQVEGVRDDKEAQRYLFILEGQKLVSPYPEGDFTSKIWFLTKTGQKAVRLIQKQRMLKPAA